MVVVDKCETCFAPRSVAHAWLNLELEQTLVALNQPTDYAGTYIESDEEAQFEVDTENKITHS